MSKHTPGPWVAEYDEYGDEIWFGGRGCGTWTIGPAYIGGDGLTQEGQERMAADARLIAAAPELLEALDNLLKVIDGEGGTKPNACEMARAAIAKAIGETP